MDARRRSGGLLPWPVAPLFLVFRTQGAETRTAPDGAGCITRPASTRCFRPGSWDGKPATLIPADRPRGSGRSAINLTFALYGGHASQQGSLFPRHAERMTAEALADTRVVVVNGARQVGKSTLAELLPAPCPGRPQLTA